MHCNMHCMQAGALCREHYGSNMHYAGSIVHVGGLCREHYGSIMHHAGSLMYYAGSLVHVGGRKDEGSTFGPDKPRSRLQHHQSRGDQ